ncbi:MAG: family 10 glycosylhydrolase [Tannerella sp.]|jgi:uncharacterized lipoprotein YddW (UPF0748 family)|nr:family 10 glycosylhydrolase [Tannerella sp.]
MNRPGSIFKQSILSLILLIANLPVAGSDYPKQEIRAVWLTTIFGLDWPRRTVSNKTEEIRQKQELCDILDSLRDAHFNTVFVQTRLRGDVIYDSKIEPVSKVFTGYYGRLPGYDPLQYIIDECHKRGMECHAFFVTFPVGSARVVAEQGASSVVNRRPELCLQHRNEWYLDPGLPETADYVLSLVKEVVQNYDIDGVQFDYIRYPEAANSFPDQRSYAKYGNGQQIADWRRENINRFIGRIHDWVKQEKPWVQVSSSPLGKYRRLSQYPNIGWTAYDDVFQDPKAWLQAGKQDMIVPMMYYRQNDFYPFVNNWMEQTTRRSRVVGLGAYRLSASEGNWNLSEIKDQMDYARKQGVAGLAFFRTQFVIENEKGLYHELKYNFFKYPAQLPPLVWMNDAVPDAPREIVVKRDNNYLKLTWDAPSNEDYVYTVYYAPSNAIDTDKAQSILATGIRGTEVYLPVNINSEQEYSFCVTASNRYRIESQPSRGTYYYLSKYEK